MKSIKSICVFCASSERVDAVYRDAATELGERMGKAGLDLVYGGASIGLMGCVARAVQKEGRKVVAVLPEFLNSREIGYEQADELIVPKTMRDRKAIMDERSDAFIVLPGGVGTLEETFEILSMRQLRLTEKPMVFVNVEGFFDNLIAFCHEIVGLKFAKPEFLDLIVDKPTPAEALEFVLESGKTGSVSPDKAE